MKKISEQKNLSGKQRKFLRGLGHHLTQSVIVGKDGISDNLVRSCVEGLDAHELIKIKLGQNCPVGKKDAAKELAARTNAQLVQLIGKTILLYKSNKNLSGEEKIQLPR